MRKRARAKGKELNARSRHRNRARFLEEASHGIYTLMQNERHTQAWLARRLGVSPPMVSKVLEGSHNFTLEILADVFLALGRSVHLVLGMDTDEMRLVRDEGAEKGSEVPSSATFTYPITNYRHLLPTGGQVTRTTSEIAGTGPIALAE